MDGFHADLTEEYWNKSETSKNVFSDEDEETSLGDDLLQPAIDMLTTSKNVNTIPLQNLISKANLDLGNKYLSWLHQIMLYAVLADQYKEIFHLPPSISDCIKNLFLGYSCQLNYYKRLDQKLELLDKAIETYDGNVIMTVILFLERTLNFNIFLKNLLNKKLALSHYYHYLLIKRDIDKLNSIQMAVNDYFDMMDVFYLTIRHSNSTHDIKQKLERHMGEHIGYSGFEKDILNNYKIFLDFQTSRKLNYKSVTELLAFKIKDNLERHGSIDNSETVELKSHMKLSDFQYEWIKFNVVSALLMWNKILEFFIHTKRFTSKKEIKSVLSKELILQNLYKRDAPKHIMEAMLSAMSMDEVTLHWAEKAKCYKFLTDYYVSQKDKTSLLQLMSKLSPNSEEFLYANIKSNSDNMWKN